MVNKNKYYQGLLKKCIIVAKQAGKFLKNTKSIKVLSDRNRDIKLNVDLKSESIIFKKLSKYYPVLSEESGGVLLKNNAVWIVDPLDGTVNYQRKIPLNCISISLWHRKKPVLGVVYDFMRNELFTGIIGNGAKLNGKKIMISSIKKISQSIIFTGFPVGFNLKHVYIKKFMSLLLSYKKIRLIGSAALSLAYVASGRADAYHERGIKIWDVAAGLALVKAAGGFYKIKNLKNGLDVFASNKSYINKV